LGSEIKDSAQALHVAMFHLVQVLGKPAVDLSLSLGNLVLPSARVPLVGKVVFEDLGNQQFVQATVQMRKGPVEPVEGAVGEKFSGNIRVSYLASC
jgi:hypothetical protein